MHRSDMTRYKAVVSLFQRLFSLALLCILYTLFLSACGSGPVVLSGTITDAYSGEPVEMAQISVDQFTATTGADGTYHTADWEAEDMLIVSAPGYETTSIPLVATSSQAESAEIQQQLDASGIVTLTLDAQLRPTTLEGIVTDTRANEPLAEALVVAQMPADTAAAPADRPVEAEGEVARAAEQEAEAPAAQVNQSRQISTTTDADGRYMLDGLTEEFVLTISAPDHAPVEIELARTTSYDAKLRPNVFGGSVRDKYSNEPISGARVAVGSITATTDDEGRYEIKNVPDKTTNVRVSAEGYAEAVEPIKPPDSIDVALRPDVLEAALFDKKSGDHIRFATVIATETPTSTAVASVRFDNSRDGSFKLEGLPESGYLHVLAPGYRKSLLEITPGNIPARIELEPFQARALYVKTSTVAYMPERMQKFYDIIDNTELNALVIDLKSDNLADLGLIYYDSQVPIVRELGTSADLMDIRAILAETKKRNIYTIARIHIFAHDNLLAETKPEWAARNTQGCVPNENRKCNGDVFYADWDIAWLDPWNRNVWDYNIQLGVEAAQLGFDEVQFDYIRFPNDARDIEHMELSKPVDWENNPQPMYENIATFMEQAHEAINSAGAFFSVDIFGYAVWAPQANIGQNAALMSPHADYICPMVYPSHFWTNELGLENAAAHPYEIVAESLERGQQMIAGKRAKMRPWLQDFTLIWVPDPLIVRYGVNEVRAQIQAVEDRPYAAGWALWDPDNEYTLEAFESQE